MAARSEGPAPERVPTPLQVIPRRPVVVCTECGNDEGNQFVSSYGRIVYYRCAKPCTHCGRSHRFRVLRATT